VVDDSTIQATVPIGTPGVQDITVTAPSGTSPVNAPADHYTFQGNWFAYVPDFGGAQVFPIDVMTLAVHPSIPIKAGPNDVIFSPDGIWAVSVNSQSNSIAIIDTATQTPLSTLPVGQAFPIVAVTPDCNLIAIVNYSSNSVTFINMLTMAMTVVPVGANPSSIRDCSE